MVLSLLAGTVHLHLLGMSVLAGGPLETELSLPPLSLASAYSSDLPAGILAAQNPPPPGGTPPPPPPGNPPPGGAAPSDTVGLYEKSHQFGVKGGIGFTIDPDSFLMGLQGDWMVAPNISVGPLFQIGVSDNIFLFAPTLNGQWTIPLPFAGWERVRPFVNGGLGLLYLKKDRRGPDVDDFGFLFNVGTGAEFILSPDLSLGTHMLFNVIPDKVIDENFFFSWQVVTARFLF